MNKSAAENRYDTLFVCGLKFRDLAGFAVVIKAEV